MRVGTKSILFGAHCFFIHPLFTFIGWWKVYGFPWDVRLWIAFFLHDLGYFGKPNMDGPEGEEHPVFAAKVMSMFDRKDSKWSDLCLYHSRFYAKKNGQPFSKLCVADKMAIILTPAWLYLPMAKATGEIKEYMKLAKSRTDAGEPKYASMKLTTNTEEQWYADVQEYLRRWIDEHKDGRQDTWTPRRDSCQCEPYMPRCDFCRAIIAERDNNVS
jgi:hypothetical protein